MNITELSKEIEHVSHMYAEKFGIERDATWFLLKLQEEVGELTQSYLMLSGQARTKGKSPAELQADLQKEVADVFGQIILLALFFKVDLEQELQKKWLNPRKGTNLDNNR